MKQTVLARVIAVILILLLFFGVYWGVSVAPRKQKYWADIKSVSTVSSASISLDDNTILISQIDAQKLFKIIQDSSEYSPNHPSSIRKGSIVFMTDKGAFSFILSDTTNQGILLYPSSPDDTVWNYGTRRYDDLASYLSESKK